MELPSLVDPGHRVELPVNPLALVFGTEGDTDPAHYRDLVGLSGDGVRARAA